MASIHVYLENGFEHDHVTVSAGDDRREELDVSTRYQVGLAAVVELRVPDGAPAELRVAVPGRGLAAEATVDPGVTPHVRVNVTGGALDVRPERSPPMFA